MCITSRVFVPASGGIPPFGGRTLVFGNVLVSKDKILSVTMKNVGSAACNVSNYKFVSQFGPIGPGSCSARDCDDFHLIAPYPSGTLNPGDTTAVTINIDMDTDQPAARHETR